MVLNTIVSHEDLHPNTILTAIDLIESAILYGWAKGREPDEIAEMLIEGLTPLHEFRVALKAKMDEANRREKMGG